MVRLLKWELLDELLALGRKYANMFEVQAKYYKEQEEREQDE